MIDLTGAELHLNRYGGSEKKIAVKYKDKRYMLKFPDPVREKSSDLKYMYNAFSEDIGCRIFKTLGFDVQKTFLAKFDLLKYFFDGDEKIVVACEDFCQEGAVLSEFSKCVTSDFYNFEVSSAEELHKAKRVMEIEIVEKVMSRHHLLRMNAEFKDKFWEMLVVDTLIGNPDRHSDNWGFIERKGEIKFAPIYDCGSALSPLLSDEQMEKIMESEAEFKNREYNITLAFKYEGERISCPSFYKKAPMELEMALSRVVPKIDFEKIDEIIAKTEGLSEIRKKYLKKALHYRYDKILLSAFRKYEKEQAKYAKETEELIQSLMTIEPAKKTEGVANVAGKTNVLDILGEDTPEVLSALTDYVEKEFGYSSKQERLLKLKAIEAYEKIRQDKDDVEKIAKNLSMDAERIRMLKQYLFFEGNRGGILKNIEPDLDVAESWNRIANEPENIQIHDRILIDNAIMEFSLIMLEVSETAREEVSAKNFAYYKQLVGYYEEAEAKRENGKF